MRWSVAPPYVVAILCIVAGLLHSASLLFYCVPVLALCSGDVQVPSGWSEFGIFVHFVVLFGSSVAFAIDATLHGFHECHTFEALLVCVLVSMCFDVAARTSAFRDSLTTDGDTKISFQKDIRSILTAYLCAVLCVALCIAATSEDIPMDDTDLVACLLATITVYVWTRDSMDVFHNNSQKELLDQLRCTGQVAALVRSCVDMLHDRDLAWSDVTVSASMYLGMDILWYVLCNVGCRRRKRVQPMRKL